MDGGFDALAPRTQAALQAIRGRMGLEFCGLDCCLMEGGAVVVFECNATMNFNPNLFDAPGTRHNRSCLPLALSAMRRLIETKTGKSLSQSIGA
jgi:glutathione synthase/RimK-type ligase-like ATP-grasp enzyme